jgi:hypothetical protein
MPVGTCDASDTRPKRERVPASRQDIWVVELWDFNLEAEGDSVEVRSDRSW